MKLWSKTTRLAVLAVLLIATVASSAAETPVASQQFLTDCQALSKGPHRLSGTEEFHRASDYIAKRLQAIGVDRVIVQEYPTTQTKVKRCEIVLDNPQSGPVRLALTPMRPNGIMAPVTLAEGVSGSLYHAGAGRPEDFTSGSPRGCLVVLDYNCDRGWIRALRMGAKAVIFVANGQAQSRQSHVFDTNANFLRYYYTGKRSDLPAGVEATIHSEIVWEPAAGRNVLGFIRGSDPVFQLKKEELIIIAAHLDSFGEVPRLSPGGRGAANCAGLLKLAAYLKAHRPRRHILLAFFDGQARCHTGSSAFYRVFDRKVDIKDRQEWHDLEKRFLEQMSESLGWDQPLRKAGPVRREVSNRLKSKGEAQVYKINSTIRKLRLSAAVSGLEKDSPAYARLKTTIETLGADKDHWNDLRRALTTGAFEQDDAQVDNEVKSCLQIALAEVGQDVAIRSKELQGESRALASDRAIKDLIGDYWINLHISLLIGDRTDRWGLAIGGESPLHGRGDRPGLYVRIQGTFLSAYKALESTPKAAEHFERRSADGTLSSPDLLFAAPVLVHSGEVAGGLGIYNLALCTVQEDQRYEGTPDDRLELLDLGRMDRQFAEIGAVLGQVADSAGLSTSSAIASSHENVFPRFKSDHRAHGPLAMGQSPGSAMPNTPMSGVTIRFYPLKEGSFYPYQPKKAYAFDDFQVLRTNHNGSYVLGPFYWERGKEDAWGFAAAFDPQGRLTYVSNLKSEGQVQKRLNMFRCRRQGAVICPPSLFLRDVQVIDAASNGLFNSAKSYYRTQDGVVAWFCDQTVDAVKLFQLDSVVTLVNGTESLEASHEKLNEDQAYKGKGLSLLPATPPLNVTRRAAGDLWRLNEARMQVLRAKGVSNSSVEALHGRTEDLLRDSSNPARSIAQAQALTNSAFLAERPVYTDSRGTFDDLIRAVLVLLALSVPFAFALERLLIGSTNIYRQIIWFSAIFCAAFAILFFSHPAFAVSSTPMIIFLGFAVVLLSSLVIVIIMRKFEVELKVLQGLRSTVHAADVSRFGTIMTAMSMGISTMRRRPLRTALTAITILLLTFTILCFASFGTQTGVIRLFVTPPPGYAGVLVRQVNWAKLDPDLLNIIKGRWDSSADLCPRYWISPESGYLPRGLLITRQDGSRPVAIQGLLGFDPKELRHRSDLAKLLGSGSTDLDDNTVWMTRAVAERLGIGQGDHVLIDGVTLRVGPLLEAAKLSITKDMDDSDILPVDFAEMGTMLISSEAIRKDPMAMRHRQAGATLSADSVVIVSSATAVRMGASLRTVNIYVDDPETAMTIAEDLARMLPMPISATRHDGVYRHLLGSKVQASGAKDLLFPILLGGLIIFGTMLGSVADREKEIYTFSALGLGPSHVAGLFFAEAMVYSVIGGLGGYMLAQGSMKILSEIAAFGFVRLPEMNYSSTNAVVTILIVMGTVLISAIYPAIKASRSANPGILRTWRLPTPQGDTFHIVFPFTVSEYDITGVVSFLKEHFDNFADTGLGVFMASGSRLIRGPSNTVGLGAHLALAPFDLGVTQSFELQSVTSEIPGIDEVKITLERKSGQPKDWQRLNKILLDDLRRQFLIWRSLPSETMETYRMQTLTELAP